MKVSKKRLKRIIRETLLRERINPEKVMWNVYELGLKPNGVSLSTIDAMYGSPGFDAIDKLQEDDKGILDDEEGVFYSDRSPGMESFLAKRGF